MAKRLLENNRAEQEADRIGAQFASSNDVMGDMGKTFNFDFSNVKMHGGSEGASMAASHGDLAYAQGNNAYFGADILNKHTPEANMAVGHELTHVMQQNDGTGVSEHVPFGETQGLGFFGKVRGFFRNMFMGKKEKQQRSQIYKYLQSEGIYENDDKYETTETLLEKESGQRERGRVLEFLRSRDALSEGDEQKSTEELQAMENEILERERIIAYLKSSKTYTKGDENKTLDELQAKERDQIEKQPLYDEIRALGKPVTPGDINGPMDRLREKIKGIKTTRSIEAGDMASEVEFSEEDRSTEFSINYTDFTKIKNQYFSEDWRDARDRQKKDAEENGNARYRLGNTEDSETAFASKTGENMLLASEGYKTAYMLLSKTPLYKKIVDTVNAAGLGEYTSRLLMNVKPVYMERGKFVSSKDKEAHEWNINYLKSVSVNPTDTSVVESYIDEILGMHALVVMFLFNGKDYIKSNFEMAHRMALISVNFDWYKRTKVFKEYLKSLNNGVEVDPYNEDSWPPKAKAAAYLSETIALLGNHYVNIQGENGVFGQTAIDMHFTKDESKANHNNLSDSFIKDLAFKPFKKYEAALSEYQSKGGGRVLGLHPDAYTKKRG